MKLKKIIFTLLFMATCGLWAGEAALLKLLPADAPMVASGNLTALLRQPDIAQLLAANQELKTLERTQHFKFSDLQALVVANLNFSDQQPIALISFKKAPALTILEQLNAAGNDFKVQRITYSGREAMKFSGRKLVRPILVTTYDAQTWLMTPYHQHRQLAAQLGRSKSGYHFPTPLSGVVKFGMRPENVANTQMEYLTGALNLTGKNSHDLRFNFRVKLTTPAMAQQLKMQIPAFYAIFINMIAADRPDLGEQLIQALKVQGQPQGTQLDIQLLLPEKLLTPTAELLQNFQKNSALRQNQRAPRPNRSGR